MRFGILTLLAFGGLEAMADERSLSFALDNTVSSMVIDRGEQLSALALESEIVVEWAGEKDVIAAGIYRLSPFGTNNAAFPEEVDFFVGYSRDMDNYAVSLSAAWLTYPGETKDENSLELAGSVSLASSWTPTLAGFYDADFEDWGLELSAGPTWQIRNWEAYALARIGFVKPGDGSDTRSYLGAETGLATPLNDNTQFGVFARAEFAD